MRPTPLIELTCKWCDKPFKVKFKYREQKFCSLACTGHYGNRNKVNKFQKPCKICSKPLTTIPSRVAKGRGKYCSKECYTVAMKGVPHASPSEETKMKLSEQRRGKLNPAFKHGESESMSQYNSRFNKMLKDKIMTRDNHQCNWRSEEHTSELQSPDHLVCRLLLEKKKKMSSQPIYSMLV